MNPEEMLILEHDQGFYGHDIKSAVADMADATKARIFTREEFLAAIADALAPYKIEIFDHAA